MKSNTVRTMMLTKRNIIKMMMIVLEYSEYSSAGKASNAKATNQGAGILHDDDDDEE